MNKMPITKNDNYIIIDPLETSLNASNSATFKNNILKMLDGSEDKIIIDLSNVDFIDSSGLGALISVLKSKTEKQELILCHLSKSVEKLFTLTRMDQAFKIEKNRDSAIKFSMEK